MKPPHYSLLPFTWLALPVWAFCLLLGQGALAQRLSGIPDPTFNVRDSGLSVINLSLKNWLFTPAKAGGIIATNVSQYGYNIQKDRHAYYGSYYLNSKLDGFYNPALDGDQPYENGTPIRTQSGKIFIAVESSKGAHLFSADSLTVYRSKAQRDLNQTITTYRTYFPYPFRGFPYLGIEEVGTNQEAFWMTSGGADTSSREHNQTTLIAMNDAGKTSGVRLTVPNFQARMSASYQGNIYLLGYDIIQDSVPAGLSIRVFNGTTLQSVIGLFPNLSNVLQYPPSLFFIDANGNAIVGGATDVGAGVVDQLIKILPDGTASPWGGVTLGGQVGTLWSRDSIGNIYCARVQAGLGGLGGTLSMGKLTTLNQFITKNVILDKSLRYNRPIMFHPDLQAFLMETGDIYPTTTYKSPSNYGLDSSYGKRYRYYVSLEGKTWPLVNHDGIGQTQDVTYFTAHPSLNKLMLNGNFLQINQTLMPGMAVLNADGTLDTTFKGLHKSDFAVQQKTLNYAGSWGTLTNSGKILVNYPAANDYTLSYQDSIFRLLPSGKLDASYKPVLGRSSILKLKDGSFATIQVLDPQGKVAWFLDKRPLEIKVIKLDAEGVLAKTLADYTPTGYPDTAADATTRNRVIVAEDNQKAIWVRNTWTTYRGSTANIITVHDVFLRVDTTGHIQSVYSDEYEHYTIPIKIEILHGKKIRLTGTFHFLKGTYLDKVANIIVTDSTGKLDPTVAPIFLTVPDAYGNRKAQSCEAAVVLADGRIISRLASPNTSAGYVVRNYPDGRYDPTFLPIAMWQQPTGYEVLGNRLYIGGQNSFPFRLYHIAYNIYGTAAKNGLAAFLLNQRPANTGYVLGRVEQVTSPATGCNPAGARKPARGMVLSAEPGGHVAIADTGGNYTMVLDLGNYTIGQKISNNFLQRQVCPAANAPRTVAVLTNGAALTGQDFINQSYDCPRLDLKCLTPRFRLCSRSTIQLQYANDGTAPEPAARVRLNLPSEVSLLSANAPYRKDADSTYVFDLGTLAPGAHGTLILQDSVACPTGAPDSLARACYSARIEPLSLCSKIDPVNISWDGAWLDAWAQYYPGLDKVQVTIKNRGTNMADSTPVTLVSNGYRYLGPKLKLAAQDSLVILVPPALSGTLYLNLQQTPNCPLGSSSSLWQSGRGTARSFLNFGSGLLETYTVQACPTYRYSYDPNEKTVEPKGAVEPGTELHYTIYFENYGNDTAFAVSVEDTLDAGLDVSTLKLGATSHPCTVTAAGTTTQPVLFFTFNPIRLPGKQQDSVHSKGQLAFSIRTKVDIARGSVIPNRAHIYFDRNPAITTNYAYTGIADQALTQVKPALSGLPRFSLYPNPSQGVFTLALHSGADQMAKVVGQKVRITSLQGQVVFEAPLPEKGQLRVEHLTPGVYTVLLNGYYPQRLLIVQ